jgi:hypothetical protein
MAVVLAAALAAGWAQTVALAGSARAEAAHRGASWLGSRQESNGSFGDDRSDLVAETLAAAVAGGVGNKVVTKALGYIEKHGEDDATEPALTGRIIAGIVAGGGDPRDFGGVDYTVILTSQYDVITGAYEDKQFFSNLLAANGALAADGELPLRAADYIESNACTDGGFGFSNECAQGPDVDTTSWAINVLVAAGEGSRTVVKEARAYLLDSQRSDGGWGFSEGIKTGADSTGLALAALEALDENAQKAPWRQADGDNPVTRLMRLQLASGAFVNGDKKADVTSTTNAVPGLARTSYPISPPDEAPDPDPQPRASEAPGGGSGKSGGSDNDADGNDASTSSKRRGSGGASNAASGASSDEAEGGLFDDDDPGSESFDRPEVEKPGPSLLANPLVWVGAALAGGGAGFFGWRLLGR